MRIPLYTVSISDCGLVYISFMSNSRQLARLFDKQLVITIRSLITKAFLIDKLAMMPC